MTDNKLDLLNDQIDNLEEIISELRLKFDVENDLADEYSFLKLAKKGLIQYAATQHLSSKH